MELHEWGTRQPEVPSTAAAKWAAFALDDNFLGGVRENGQQQRPGASDAGEAYFIARSCEREVERLMPDEKKFCSGVALPNTLIHTQGGAGSANRCVSI